MAAREKSKALSVAQHHRLDQLAQQAPESKVIGWRNNGPLIRGEDTLHYINVHGRLVALRP